MGLFTPKHSWGNVTGSDRPDKDFTSGKWAPKKQAKHHADKHNNPSKYKQGKNAKGKK
jgi:hypothetical protein